MDYIRITPVHEEIQHHNLVSGHSWSETGRLLGYEVRGGFFTTSWHRSLKSAEKEERSRRDFNAKWPWTPPKSRKEKLKNEHDSKVDYGPQAKSDGVPSGI